MKSIFILFLLPIFLQAQDTPCSIYFMEDIEEDCSYQEFDCSPFKIICYDMDSAYLDYKFEVYLNENIVFKNGGNDIFYDPRFSDEFEDISIPEITFEDINFDGHLDLRVSVESKFADYYLFDPNLNKFQETPYLEYVNYYDFKPEEKTLKSIDGNCCDVEVKIFKWVKFDKLELRSHIHTIYDPVKDTTELIDTIYYKQ